ncbi:MAG: AAA family ATPase [Myxococcota bacterium]
MTNLTALPARLDALLEARFQSRGGGPAARLRPETGGAFIGRETERASLTEALAVPGAFVTLLGPGGIGKTRLAGEWIRAFSRPDEVVYVELAGRGRSLARELASALHLPPAREDHSDNSLLAALDLRSAPVLVFDNAESQVAALGASIRVWRAAIPRLRLLVTSRVRLGLPDESVFPVPPLPAEEAWALFVARARSSNEWSPPPEEHAALATLLRQLEGLPLAIELAAARARLLTPTAMVERMTERFTLLRTSAPRQPAHHQTLEATLQWSWDLLEPVERNLLAQLSVFRQTFGAEQAEAVADLDGVRPVLDAVERLLDASLLTIDRTRRLDLLESVRDFARRKLGLGPLAEAANHRHAQWFVAAARRASRAGASWVDLASARPDLESAFHWTATQTSQGDDLMWLALALAELSRARGPLDEGPELLARLGSVPESHPGVGHRAVGRIAGLLVRAHDFARAISTFERAAGLAASIDDQGARAEWTGALGWLRWSLGERENGLGLLVEARERARTVAASRVLCVLEAHLGLTTAVDGDTAAAERHFRAAVAAGAAHPGELASARHNWGRLLYNLGRDEDARRLQTAALDYAQAHGRLDLEVAVLEQLARLDHRSGARTSAWSRLGRSRELMEQMNDGPGLASLHRLRGALAATEGRFGDARRELERARALNRHPTHPNLKLMIQIYLGDVLRQSEDFVGAQRELTKAQAHLEAHPSGYFEIMVAATMGAVEHRLGRPDEARRQLADAASKLDAHGLRPGTPPHDAVRELRALLLSSGDRSPDDPG